MNKYSGSNGVAIWIGIGVVMLLVQVILGGVTRLTGSGLSITEWNVITGALPPMSEQAWIVEFEKYKQTPQFHLLNTGFTPGNFKFIFFWEWLHRFWARLIGIVFIAGFVYLAGRRLLKKEMVRPLLILFLLGALQGAVGWIMVASGLTGDAVYVKPAKLALHFIFAMGLIGYAYWFLLELTVGKSARIGAPLLKKMSAGIIVLLIIQLIYGALMAGHKAATAAPTWPDINGSLIPQGLLKEQPVLINFIDNKILIHFVHRSLAYISLLLTAWFTVKVYRLKNAGIVFKKFRPLPMMLVCLQILLGISALLVSPQIIPNHWGIFEWLAQLHQVTGMLLALSFISFIYLLKKTV
jgi:cytochrome c oxidase assembly protein subunit 15